MPSLRRAAGLLLVLMIAGAALSACAVVNMFKLSAPKTTLPGERVSILSFDTKLQPDARLASVAVVVPPAQRNADWPQPAGAADHVLGSIAAPENLKLIWQVNIGPGGKRGSRVTTPPIVVGGKAIAIDTAVRVSAFDAKTGRGLWRTKLAISDEESEVGFGGGVASDNGRLFVSTGFGDVFALKPEDGSIVWRVKLGEPFRNPPTAAGGHVYVTSVENTLYVLDEADGKVVWNYHATVEGAHILSATTPAVSSDAIVAPFTSGEISAFLPQNGRITWSDQLTRTGRLSSLTTLNDIAGDPVIDQGWVFAVGHSGRMVAIDLRSGQRIWSQEIPSVQMPWVAGDFIYAVTTEGDLVCVYRRDGGIKWLTALGGYSDTSNKKPIVWNGPILLGDRLFIVSSKHRAVFISATTGKILKTMRIDDQVFARPVAADGMVYMLTNDGKLVAYGDQALRGKARPSQPRKIVTAKPDPGEIERSRHSFWDWHVPAWVPVF
jgi:outer membrane protein assembly factor BamB